MRKFLQLLIDSLIPLSLFFSPLLIFCIDWQPHILGPIISKYLIISLSIGSWLFFIFVVKHYIARPRKLERQRFAFILVSIILILCAIASAFALHFANKRLSGVLFFSLLFTLGFFSLDAGLCIRVRKNVAMLSRFFWYCGLSFLSFRIFQEDLIWQRLFFGLALSSQAFSWELAKELDSRFASCPSAIHDPSSLKFIIIPLKISLLIGPALIGLLSLGFIIPFKYSMVYPILLFSARVIASITHSITSKVIPCFARQVLALYLLFFVTLVGIRLI